MTYILISWSISNKNTRLYTQFIVKNIVQIKYLHCIFMVLYKTISIFPLASLVVLYVFTLRNISIHILTNIDLNLVANVMKKMKTCNTIL